MRAFSDALAAQMAFRQLADQVSYALPGYWVCPARGNLRQWFEDKITAFNRRMRQR